MNQNIPALKLSVATYKRDTLSNWTFLQTNLELQ